MQAAGKSEDFSILTGVPGDPDDLTVFTKILRGHLRPELNKLYSDTPRRPEQGRALK